MVFEKELKAIERLIDNQSLRSRKSDITETKTTLRISYKVKTKKGFFYTVRVAKKKKGDRRVSYAIMSDDEYLCVVLDDEKQFLRNLARIFQKGERKMQETELSFELDPIERLEKEIEIEDDSQRVVIGQYLKKSKNDQAII